MNRISIGTARAFRASIAAGALFALFQPGTAHAAAAVARYLATGTLDTSFDGDGKLLFDVPSSTMTEGAGVGFDTAGNIIVAGHTRSGSAAQTVLVFKRLASNGAADTSFGGTGRVTFDFSAYSEEQTTTLMTESTGSIVIGGYGTLNGENDADMLLARFSATGALQNFSSAAVVSERNPFVSQSGYLWGLTSCGGKIWGAGQASFGSGPSAMVVRFSTNLLMDGTPTYLAEPTTVVDELGAIVCDPALNKVIAAGEGFVSDGWRFMLTRTNFSGFYDTTFGPNGAVINDLPTTPHEGWTDILIEPTTGKLVTVGYIEISTGARRIIIGRFLSNGTLDTTFGQNGLRILELPTAHEMPTSVARDSAGRYLVAGWAGASITGGARNFFVARFTASGAIDTSFSADGWDMPAFGTTLAQQEARDIAIAPDGRIVVVGFTR